MLELLLNGCWTQRMIRGYTVNLPLFLVNRNRVSVTAMSFQQFLSNLERQQLNEKENERKIAAERFNDWDIRSLDFVVDVPKFQPVKGNWLWDYRFYQEISDSKTQWTKEICCVFANLYVYRSREQEFIESETDVFSKLWKGFWFHFTEQRFPFQRLLSFPKSVFLILSLEVLFLDY